jgi:hypothetical protein
VLELSPVTVNSWKIRRKLPVERYILGQGSSYIDFNS